MQSWRDTLTASLNYTNMTAINVLTGRTWRVGRTNLGQRGRLPGCPCPAPRSAASVTYQGKRFDDAGNFTPLTSNTTVNLFGSYDLTRAVAAVRPHRQRVQRPHRAGLGYGVPGIGAFGGVRAAF